MTWDSFIYGLACPDSGEVRYIGKAVNVSRRLKSHLRDSVKRKTPVYCWIRSLAAAGKTPVAVELACTNDWRVTERDVIAQWRDSGARLLNLAGGGDEPYCPPEVRAENGRKVAKIRQIDPTRKRLWELKRNLSDALRRGYVSAETRAKMRALAASKPHEFGMWMDA